MSCGCEGRKQWLNERVPGLGDRVGAVLDPIWNRRSEMADLLKPDMKSLVWLAIGAFVVPYVLKMVK